MLSLRVRPFCSVGTLDSRLVRPTTLPAATHVVLVLVGGCVGVGVAVVVAVLVQMMISSLL